MKKVLITGFQPFNGETINPSIEAIKRLPDTIANGEIIKLEIPVERNTSLAIIEQAIEEHQPDIILSIGQAGGRSDISVERVGINVDDYLIADNANQQPIDEPIDDEGPAAYFTNLPIKLIVQNLQQLEIPASISNTAGTYVCNHVLYGVRHMLSKKNLNVLSGFVHIPFLPEQVITKRNIPSMSLAIIVKALHSIVTTVMEADTDIKVIGGKLD